MTQQNPFGMGLNVMRQLGASQGQILGNQGEQQRQQMLQAEQQRLMQTQQAQAASAQAEAEEAERKQFFDLLSNVRQLPAEQRIQALQSSPFAQAEDFSQFITPETMSDQGLDQILAASPYKQERPDQTAFMQEMRAAGINPGSEEYKSAVLERYGKGQTIGYDVIEAVNPQTGRSEYYQVSRVNPSEKIPLGIEVPKSSQELKAEAAEATAQDQELDTINNTLDTVGKILNSPALGQFSGLDQFRAWVPGSEAANVRAWVDQLQSQNFLTAVQQMKGMGALSENEGRKLSASVAALSPSMSDDAIRSELEDIQTSLLSALEKIETGNLQPGGEGGGTSNDKPKTANWNDLP